MSLPLSRYVTIVSSVGAQSSINQRALIGRIFTTNPLIPPGTVLPFSNADDVGTYFGTTSDEYARAVVYFGFISKSVTAPTSLSFSRWVSTAQNPAIYGGDATPKTLVTYTAITAGSFGLTVTGSAGGATTFSAINLSTATSLANVATMIQTAIQGYTAGGVMFTSATVTYDPQRDAFDIVMGAPSAGAVVSIQTGTTGTDLAAKLGIVTDPTQPGYDPTIVVAPGAAVETLTQTLTTSVGVSNNFGSFAFIPVLSAAQSLEVAQWNAARDTQFIYCMPILTANVPVGAGYLTPTFTALRGTAATLNNTAGTFPELMPMMIFAASDYTLPNSAQNYMYQTDASFPAEVFSTTVANTMDAANVNYFGQVQQAGANVIFYQQGVMMGLATDATDMNTYANEIWLKDDAGVAILNLQLGVNQVPANTAGAGMITSILQHTVVDQALINGTISIGKPLDQEQKLFITQVTNDPNAWYQVLNSGYWLNTVIIPDPLNAGKFLAQYTLVYSKDDVIRHVNGRHILI